MEQFKARLVAKGYTQEYGVNYEETFSPVVKMSTIRCLIALAIKKSWTIFQFDVNNTFLHGDLNEEAYMVVPQGIENPNGKVCRLRNLFMGSSNPQGNGLLSFHLNCNYWVIRS